MKCPVLSEADLAAKVVAWLRQNDWTVYQEVQLRHGGPRADVVATRGDTVWIAEAKKVLSWDLLAQARHWQSYAHMVSIAVPYAKPSKGRDVALLCVERLQLGCLEVRSLWPVDEKRIHAVEVKVEPVRRPTINPALLQSLRYEHQTHAKAGTNRGGHFTPYRETCEAVARYAVEHPGCTLREALAHVPHSYNSIDNGIAALSALASTGRSHGLELRTGDDGLVHVFAAKTVDHCGGCAT